MASTAVISALPAEYGDLLDVLSGPVDLRQIGGRRFYAGRIEGKECVIAAAGMGKVAAATTCALLIQAFAVSHIIFLGLAGGIHQDVNIGDLVIAKELVQHDMDARPLFPKHVIPSLGIARIPTDSTRLAALVYAAQQHLAVSWCSTADHTVRAPRIHTGLVLTGDQFVDDASRANELRQQFPDALCVEMEGAAVAQVCRELAVDLSVIRIVSDLANDASHDAFNVYLSSAMGSTASGLLSRYLGDVA